VEPRPELIDLRLQVDHVATSIAGHRPST
jgi:hypothetical protein